MPPFDDRMLIAIQLAANGVLRRLVPQLTPQDRPPATPRKMFDVGDLISERFWPAIAAGVLMLVVGLTAYFTSQPFLYPSLGPTAFLQAELPFHRSSRFRDTTLGHTIGVAAGLASVFVLDATGEPRLGSGSYMSPLRVGAAALTMTLVIVLEIVFKVSNPPSASTGLLFALGYFQPQIRDVVEVLAGVLFLAAFGALIRHMRSQSPREWESIDPAVPRERNHNHRT